MEVGVREVSERVSLTTIVANELTVLILTWILFSSHEEHVFEEMCGTVERLRVE